MPIVDIDNIPIVDTSQTVGINPPRSIPVASPAYNEDWGYFTFGQTVGFTYDDSDSYTNRATFTIAGEFTADAEVALGNATAGNDDTLVNAMITRFDALEALFKIANNNAPTDFSQWGTAADLRTLALPSPLKDYLGQPVRAYPVTLTMEQTQLPQFLRYQASFLEAEVPTTKLKVNNTLLDGAVLNISLGSPIINGVRIPGQAGEVFHLQNYRTTRVSVQGSLPHNPLPGTDVSQRTREIVQDLESGTMSLRVQTIDGVTREVFLGVTVENGRYGINHKERSVEITIEGRTKS